ncbi:hypothetical protein BLS_008293 [Venturia inaequalis]|uniref:Nucleolar protein 12 n=1 Tax=Venturia inaequalis TaxID=5025 RepID=A0A8H3U961_VENIN|nr:hypothetical protein BLS_008293 [Venturia inaequalis]RDI80178.1 hypothetical protein Vi05172_g9849 [Venturia inaequalis]
MAKRTKEEKSNKEKSAVPLVKSKAEIDPALASLFAQSSGPATKHKSNSAANGKSSKKSKLAPLDEDSDSVANDEDLSSVSEQDFEDEESEPGHVSDDEEEGSTNGVPLPVGDVSPDRKRKRRREENDIEGEYMDRIAREEAKEEAKLREERKSKRQKPSSDAEDAEAEADGDKSMGDASDSDDDDDEGEKPEPDFDVPIHEALAGPEGSDEYLKATRTVFLGNVSSLAMTSKTAKKTLLKHLASFISTLPACTPPHSVESIRFRSTAYSNKIPKKAAFAKKELMDATTRSTHAYAVYSTNIAAREAARVLNGTVVLDRHLHVDEVAHPAKAEARRCVFVGNLPFVDDESAMREAEAAEAGRKARKQEPSDIEEGLWREFSKIGTVESVRVVRDPKTRVGKGFAYVQFKDENSVEAALHHNDKRFPPLLPRKMRVVRAKTIKRNAVNRNPNSSRPSTGVYNRKVTGQEKTLQGRASKMLGRAGAAHVKRDEGAFAARPEAMKGMKGPEKFVFEGYRASSKQGTHGLKLGGGKKGGKPKGRSAKRGTAWKAAGGKK